VFYKETEFQNTHTGKIPSDWQDATLSDLSEHITKGTTPTTYGFSYEFSGVNFIKVESIDENGKFVSEKITHISRQANDALSRSMLKEKDILFSIAGALGRVALVSDKILPANTNQALSIIRIKEKEKVLPEYLKYFLTGPNIQEFIKSIAIQSQQANLNLEQVRKFRVGLPSVSEQNEIVGVLGVVDSAIELADRIIAKTQQLKRGLMQQLLTHGIGHAETKSTPIGIMPKEWQAVQLKDVVRSYKNGIYKPSQYAGKGRPCVRMYNIVAGKINLVNAALLNVTNQELEEFGLDQGDIVVNRVNTSELVGKAGVVPASFGKVTFESKNIRVRLDTKQILPEFLSVFVQTKAYSNQLLSKAKTAVAQATITQVDLDAIIIPLPPTIDEQEKVVRIISTVDKKLQLEKEERVKVDKIKRGLMNLLLTGKVRIKVD
jgi:type I restriction enzyme, S subunit